MQVHDLGLKRRQAIRTLTVAEKVQALHRLGSALLGRPVEFEEGRSALSAEGTRLVATIAEALRDYPELEVYVAGTVSDIEEKTLSPEELVTLADDRSLSVSMALYTDGFLGEKLIEVRGGAVKRALNKQRACVSVPTFHDASEHADHPMGCVWIDIKAEDVILLDPPSRLDFVLSRCNFSFDVGSTKLSDHGLQVATALALIIEEQGSPVTVAVPELCSQLERDRAQAIVAAIRELAPKAEVELAATAESKDCALVSFKLEHHGGGGEEEDFVPAGGSGAHVDPNVQIRRILNDTPLGFMPKSAEVVPEAIPVLRHIANAIKSCEQEQWVLRIETFFPEAGSSANSEKNIMLDRADRIADHLRAEGIRMQVITQEVVYDTLQPTIVLTCVPPGEVYEPPNDSLMDEIYTCTGGHETGVRGLVMCGQ